MPDESLLELQRKPAPEVPFGRLPSRKPDEESGSCPAYTYLRGLHERALAVEFCLRTGDREFFPYSLLGVWRFNPSVGLLLRFNSDVVSLVLIRGSNLDALVNESVNLTERGFQRHRIVAVREMTEDAIKEAGGSEPTVDRIDIAEFESANEEREWLQTHAPAFLRPLTGSRKR
jgi:hypothetical protein